MFNVPRLIRRCRAEEEEEEDREIKGDLSVLGRFGRQMFLNHACLLALLRLGYELIGDSGKRELGWMTFRKWTGREKCRKRQREQEAARERRDSIGAMTARPVLRFSSASERALVSREFDRYSGINS